MIITEIFCDDSSDNWIPDEEEIAMMEMEWNLFETELNHLVEEYGYDHIITQEFLENNK